LRQLKRLLLLLLGLRGLVWLLLRLGGLLLSLRMLERVRLLGKVVGCLCCCCC